jgi:hypothetical protein
MQFNNISKNLPLKEGESFIFAATIGMQFLGDDIRNLPISLERHMKVLHADWDGNCALCTQMKNKIGFSKSEIFSCLPFLGKAGMMPCEIALGCYILQNHLSYLQKGILETLLIKILGSISLSDDELFVNIAEMVKRFIICELLQAFDITGNLCHEKIFVDIFTLKKRACISKDVREKFGFDVKQADAIFWLQCAMMYLYVDSQRERINNFTKLKNKKTPKHEISESYMASYHALNSANVSDEDTQRKPQKLGKHSKKTSKKPKMPIGKSVPRILKVKHTKPAAATDKEDNVSVSMNKYNKRFTKTKKPGRV